MNARVNTPLAKAPPKVIAFSCGPTTTRRAMMKRRNGKTMTISISREMTVSTQPRK